MAQILQGIAKGTTAANQVTASIVDGDHNGLDVNVLGAAVTLDPTNLALAANQPALGVAGTASADVITVQGIAAMTPILVSSTTLATVAKQPALGTAGTASADVLSVQGIASMTPLLATVSQGTAASLKAEVVSTKTTNTAIPGATNLGVLPAIANAAAPTLTETYQAGLSVDLGACLRTTLPPPAAPSVTPTLQVAEYVDTNVMGGKLTITGATRLAAGSGSVTSITVTDIASNTTAVDVILFSADPSGSTLTDKAAINIVAADAGKMIGGVKIVAGDYSDVGDTTIATKAGFEWPFTLATGTSMFAAIVARGTVTPGSASDLTLKVGIKPS